MIRHTERLARPSARPSVRPSARRSVRPVALPLVLAAAGAAAGLAAEARAQNILGYTQSGQTVSQDFNSLPFTVSTGAWRQTNTDTNAPTFSQMSTFQAQNRPNAVINYPLISYAQDVYTTTNTFSGYSTNSLSSTPIAPVLTTGTAAGYADFANGRLVGWGGAQVRTTANGPQVPRFLVDDGTSTTGSLRSLGVASFVRNDVAFNPASTNTAVGTLGATPNPSAFDFQDRAIGMLASGTGEAAVSLTLRNDSVTTLTTLNLKFFIEQWRRGNTALTGGDVMPFSFAITNDEPAEPTADLTASGSVFTAAATFNLASVIATPGPTAGTLYNGNLAANRKLIDGSLAINWEPGQFLVLRWRDTDSNGNDDALGLDDVTISATGVAIPNGTPVLAWTGAASSAVNTTEVNFSSTSGPSAFQPNAVVNFTSDAVATRPTVAVDPAGVSVFQVNVSNDSGTYTLTGGGIASADGLYKTGNGTLSLRNGANSFGTTGIRVSGGTLNFTTADQLGQSFGLARVLLGAGTTLQADGNSPILASNTQIAINASNITLNTAAPLLRVGTLTGAGAFTKTGAGTLEVNTFTFTGGLTIAQGTFSVAIPTGSVANVRVDGPWAGDLVLTSAARLNIANTTASSVTQIAGGGKIYADVSGAGLSTPDNAQSFYEINNDIVLNRNNLPNFTFNLFPGFAGGAGRIVVNSVISGNGGVNFASGLANGSGNVVLNSRQQYTGITTINVIGATSNGAIGGQPVILGIDDALPTTTLLGFNTATGFSQGSSGSGRLELGFQRSLITSEAHSQTVAGLFSGNGDAPLNSFANVGTAFGTVGNTVSGSDPITSVFTVNVAAGQTYTFKGQLRGLMSFVKDGAGTQELSAQQYVSTTPTGNVVVPGIPQTSTYTGTSEIRNGTLRASVGADRLSFNAPLVLGSAAANTAGRLELVGVDQTVVALATAGTAGAANTIVNTGTVPATVTVRSENFADTAFFANDRYRDFATTTYAGTLADGTAPLSLVKTARVATEGGTPQNLGVLTLTGALNYSGNTTVDGGVLLVKKPLTPVAVNPATTLGSVTATGSVATLTLDVARTNTYTTVLSARSVTVADGALAQILPVSRAAGGLPHVAVTDTLSITTGGFLSLGTSDLIVRNADLTALRAAVATWYAGGARNGTGLGASVDTYTTLAVFPNLVRDGIAYYTTYDGVPLVAADTIVKYTYVGDTNIDGILDAADFANIIEGITTASTGWQRGDVNYDGVVNATDLQLFLAASGNQSFGPLGSGSEAGSTNGGAVPEPTALALLLPAAAALTSRRRR